MPNIRHLAHNKNMLYGYSLKEKKLANDDDRIGILVDFKQQRYARYLINKISISIILRLSS